MIDEIEQRLLKGCGKNRIRTRDSKEFEIELKKYNIQDSELKETREVISKAFNVFCGDNGELCDSCKLKLEQHRETSKAKYEEFIKILKEWREEVCFGNLDKKLEILIEEIEQKLEKKELSEVKI